MNAKNAGLWVCQLVAAGIIGMAGIGKLVGSEGNVFIFAELGMEPGGRILIGVVELAAASMLLAPAFSAMGALLAVGTMMGAIIAHATFLGFDVRGDGGAHVFMLAAVLVCSVAVLVARRRSLPFIGDTL